MGKAKKEKQQNFMRNLFVHLDSANTAVVTTIYSVHTLSQDDIAELEQVYGMHSVYVRDATEDSLTGHESSLTSSPIHGRLSIMTNSRK